MMVKAQKTQRNSKKAQFYNIFLALGTIFILILALMWLSPLTWNSIIGKKQFEAFEGYYAEEKNMLYIDVGARFAAQKTMSELAKNGGFYSQSQACGITSNGYSLWNTKSRNLTDCLPKSTDNFELLVEKQLNPYLEANKELYFLANSYEISALAKNVVGIPSQLLFFPKPPPKEIDDVNKTVSEYGLESYKITAYSELSCEESGIDDSYYAELSQTFPLVSSANNLNAGNKLIHADVKYKNYDDSDYDLVSSPNAGIAVSDIGESLGKYCFSYNANPLYNLKLETANSGKVQCSVETKDSGLFEGNDLRTWNPDQDSSCKDSKTWLQCPGIKIYYCGKTGYDSYPERINDFPDWRMIQTDDKRISTYFVEVKEDDLAEQYHIRSKTAFKFLVEIDKNLKDKGFSYERDSFVKKWIEDSASYAKTRVMSSGVKGEKQYPYFYSVEPSFDIAMDTQIKDYEHFEVYSMELLETCKSTTNLQDCITSVLQPRNLNYKVTLNGNLAEFDVYSNSSVLSDSAGKLSFQPLNYRFGLLFG